MKRDRVLAIIAEEVDFILSNRITEASEYTDQSKVNVVLDKLEIFHDMDYPHDLSPEVVSAYQKYTKNLRAKLRPYLDRIIPWDCIGYLEEAEMTSDETSKAYGNHEDEEYFLPAIYDRQIDAVEDLIDVLDGKPSKLATP